MPPPENPTTAQSDMLVRYLANELERAVNDLLKTLPTLSEGCRRQVAGRLADTLSSASDTLIESASATQMTPNHLTRPIPDLVPRARIIDLKGNERPVATEFDTANRNTLARFFDDIILLLVRRKTAEGEATHFVDIKREFEILGHPQDEGSIRTRLSRMRRDGLLQPRSGDRSDLRRRREVGSYALTSQGADLADQVFKERLARNG